MSCRNTGGQASANYEEVTGGTELFGCLTPLTIYALDGKRATTPLLVPRTSKVHDPVSRHSPQAQHRGSVCFCQIYSVIFRTEGSPWSLLPYTLSMHMHRSWEINGELTRHLFSPSRGWAGPWGEESKEEEKTNTRKRNCFAVNLTPFTPFKSPFSSESRVKITLWLRLWSCERTQRRGKNAGSFNVAVVIRKHG